MKGSYRVGDGLCLLQARNDYEAILAWLSTKREGSATRRAYRKEAERYLLWAIVQKKKAISSFRAEDCIEYHNFPESPLSVHHAIAILKAMVNGSCASAIC